MTDKNGYVQTGKNNNVSRSSFVGIPGTSRHTFATSVTLANDVSIMNVSKMLGHTKLSMTQHYAKVLDQSIRKDMENVKTLPDANQPDRRSDKC